MLARAARLNTPLYLHSNIPPKEVREAYYEGLPGIMGAVLATGGWGWHSETALHIRRLVLSGTLDRHRGLKLNIGHMGEGLPAILARIDNAVGRLAANSLDGTVSQKIMDQVWITTSGFFFLAAPFMAALMTFGPDRILFSVDYPFNSNEDGTRFLLGLPVSPADLAKIAHGNADRLLKLDVSQAL